MTTRSHNCPSISTISLHLIQQSFISLTTDSSHYLLVSFFRNLCINQANFSNFRNHAVHLQHCCEPHARSCRLRCSCRGRGRPRQGTRGASGRPADVLGFLQHQHPDQGRKFLTHMPVLIVTDRYSVRSCEDQREDQ